MKSVATVKITDMKRGESRLYYDDSWGNSGQYHYTDGNASCDCNRNLYFQYAHGANWDNADDVECGDGGFRIDSVFYEGRIVYSELDGTAYAE